MSDYPFVITPKALCEKCDHRKETVKTSLGTMVLCGLYGCFYDNEQAEHCINYYIPKYKKTSKWDVLHG